MKKFAILSLLFLLACNKPKHEYSFYYWKTILKFDETEKEALKSSNDTLYLRLFDIDKNKGTLQLIAPVKKDKDFTTTKKITPVVTITNRTFNYIKIDVIQALTDQIINGINNKEQELGIKFSNEIQIDCDWTAGTMLDYFEFLKLLKKTTAKNISVTLRLHQVKFKDRMGIPPADRVFLMCATNSAVFNQSQNNSILNLKTMENHLGNLETYPIKNLSVVLPMYSWGVITNHKGNQRLIEQIEPKELASSKFEFISKDEVEILENGFYFGQYLNKGFKVKIKKASKEELKETIAFLDDKIDNYTIIYLHLNSQYIKDRSLNL